MFGWFSRKIFGSKPVDAREASEQEPMLRQRAKELAIAAGPKVTLQREEAAFTYTMKSVQGLSEREKSEIFSMVQSCGGFGLPHNYMEPVFQRYFAERPWAWLEIAEWRTIFDKARLSTPLDFPEVWEIDPAKVSVQVSREEALEQRTVAELKETLAKNAIPFRSGARKAELVQLLAESGCSEVDRLYYQFQEQKRRSGGYGLYKKLMRCINFRAMGLGRRSAAGNTFIKEELVVFDTTYANVIERYLAGNPDAMLPLFPGDHSFFHVQLNFRQR